VNGSKVERGKVEKYMGHEKVQLQDERKRKGDLGALYLRVHGHPTNLHQPRGSDQERVRWIREVLGGSDKVHRVSEVSQGYDVGTAREGRVRL
jgi:hypothetical protein